MVEREIATNWMTVDMSIGISELPVTMKMVAINSPLRGNMILIFTVDPLLSPLLTTERTTETSDIGAIMTTSIFTMDVETNTALSPLMVVQVDMMHLPVLSKM